MSEVILASVFENFFKGNEARNLDFGFYLFFFQDVRKQSEDGGPGHFSFKDLLSYRIGKVFY